MRTRIQILRDIAEIEAFRADWIRLQKHPNADIDLFYTSIRTQPQVTGPYVLVLLRDEIPAAIAIGKFERKTLNVQIGYVSIPGPKVRELVFIYGGVLGDPTPNECDLMIRQVVNSLRDGEADYAHLNHYQPNCPFYTSFVAHTNSLVRDFFPTSHAHLLSRTPESESALWNHMSAKKRKNIRRLVSKLEKDYAGRVRISYLTKESDLDTIVKDIDYVACRTYQRGMGRSFTISDFELSRLRIKAEHGWLCAFILHLDDVPCAFECGTLYQKTYYYDWAGYDRSLKQYSPGIYLMIHMMTKFCKESHLVESADFGLGDADYKRIFCNEEWKEICVYRFAPTLKGAALSVYRNVLMSIDWICRKIINKNLESRIKRFWRGRLARRAIAEANTRQTKDDQE